MDKKKMITIISIVVTAIIIAIALVLIINKNKPTTKVTVAEQNINNEETIVPSEMPTEEPEESLEPSETPSTSPSPKTSKKPSAATGKYYIKVNNQMNTVTIYTKDESGNYTVPVKAMVCSTGNASPKNTKYSLKGKWNWGPLFGGVYGQYVSQINGNILFHSVPYLRKNDRNSLEYWEYDKLGTTCSAGCIRLTVADAQWIYYNCSSGTWVEFYSSSNPGPLGKPSAMKISGNLECRGWDPTDPNPNNPWRNVVIETPSPTPEPSIEPSPVETPAETPIPTPIPIVEPTQSPTPEQSAKPTKAPIETPETTTTPKQSTQPTTSLTDLSQGTKTGKE